jgi:spermidine/putrescine transport system substrate-binding protein
VTDQQRISKLMAKPINRRGFLSMMGAGAAAAGLAACSSPGASTAPSSPPASSGTSATPGASATPAASVAVESELFIYNWSDYISPANQEEFKARFGLSRLQYDIYADNEELLAKLQAGASGYDIACPTAEYVPGMVEEGFIQKLDTSRIPNIQHINPTFKQLWWDPTDEYQVPKDYGTTGILYRSDLLSKIPQSWREFYDMVKGEASQKTIFVTSQGDVFTFPLKMLGYSLNSVDQAELEEARQILLDCAPHLLALDSDTYGDKMADGQAVLTLGWTGPLGQELAPLVDEGKAGYVVPSEGTLFWMDSWVLLTDAPHPNAAYAWLNFIHEPEIQAEETNYNLYATCNDAAKEFVDEEILANAAIFPPEDVIASLEGAQDTSGSTQRADIMEEFKQAIGG